EAFAAFDAEHIDDLPSEVFDEFEAQDIQNLQDDAVYAIGTEEFALLPIESLAGFTAKNVDALNEGVLEKITSDEFKKLNSESIKSAEDPGYIFTNLNSKLISVKQVEDKLPEGWEVDENTGEFNVPEGTSLTYRTFDDSSTSIPVEEVFIADSVDLSSSFSLGGKGGEPAETLINEGLQQSSISNVDLNLFTLNQDQTGVVSIEGSGTYENIDFNFLASKENVEQAPADTPTGLGEDEGGFFTITTSKGHRFTLSPAPDVGNLLNAIDSDFTETDSSNTNTSTTKTSKATNECHSDQKIKLNPIGDVLMQLPESTASQIRAGKQTKVHVSVLFDAFKEPANSQHCPNNKCNWAAMPSNLKKGFHFPTKLRNTRAKQKAYIVYDNGVSQSFYPTTLYPDKFKALVGKIEGVEKVVYQADGGFKVTYKGTPSLLYPTFDTVVTELEDEEVVKPTVKAKKDGTFSYSVQDCSRLVTTPVILEPL
ncbi:MAG: hypothetical protein VSS52_008965, partial [Thiotrichaceae bacterium]|nr:hypothetical protein [Thiotrichaceae bacterium]